MTVLCRYFIIVITKGKDADCHGRSGLAMTAIIQMHRYYQQLPSLLLPWYEQHKRDLPWRQDREPYHVWLSEIMLQQTRVEAVKGYYSRFLAALPTIEALAQADPEQLNKLWEGLGYYSRVRNLQKAAKQVMELHGGVFPTEHSAIRALSGIGDYTAGAIGSICFGLPTPAVDGNVLRVCSRLTADSAPIDKPQTKKQLTEQLAKVYPAGACGDFTQALMELGATVCVPNGAPKCEVCPLSEICLAHRDSLETELPIKSAKKPRRQEQMTVFLLDCDGFCALRKRPDTGLLAGLWEYPHVPGDLNAEQALTQLEQWGVIPEEVKRSTEKVHIFTHVQWNMKGWYIRCSNRPGCFTWAAEQELDQIYALPTAFRQFREAP